MTARSFFLLLIPLLLSNQVAFTSSLVVRQTKNTRNSRLRQFGVKRNEDQLVDDFVDLVQQSVKERSFVSLTLRGTRKRKKTDPSLLRGSIRQVQGRLIEIKQKPILQLTLKYHGATDICKNLKQHDIAVRLSQLILEPIASEWGMEAVKAKPIQGAELKTLSNRWELKSLGRKASLDHQKLDPKATPEAIQPALHDRMKRVPIDKTADFLQALRVTNADGKPRAGMSSKLRQCNKFVEIVSGLVEKEVANPSAQAIRVVDMGCGRGYLTFALHSYLCKKYEEVQSVGIDVRPKLVAEISGIAQSLGGSFNTLSFEEGSIEEIMAGGLNLASSWSNLKSESLDILIALHACDTATDDAIWSGISRGANIIVVAPCCHKEIRPQLNTHIATTAENHPLYDVLKHAVYRERISETVTDSLRAILLERQGYKVQVFEFIGGEHTSKNVMITAVKSRTKEVSTDEIDQRLNALASLHGINKQKLAQSIGVSLCKNSAPPVKVVPISPTQMPRKVSEPKIF